MANEWKAKAGQQIWLLDFRSWSLTTKVERNKWGQHWRCPALTATAIRCRVLQPGRADRKD
jgi:hypothetical protein